MAGMKIAIVGKGGSGKTTVASLLARYVAQQEHPVLAIDADINQHLGRTLGMTEEEANELPPMGIEIDRIKRYVRGDNPRLQRDDEIIKTTPPGTGSQLLRPLDDDPVQRYFARTIAGVSLLATGPFTEDDLGVKCYHSKTGAVELFLNHLIDQPQELVLVDMTAGADSFASGMFTRFDVTYLVVEPTLNSLSVYDQYVNYAREYGVDVRVIGNKIEDADDRRFIQEQVGDRLVADFVRSDYIRRLEKGRIGELSEVEEHNRHSLQAVLDYTFAQSKDWQRFYEQAVYFHRKNAESWANAAAGVDLTEQIDPEFSLLEAIEQ